MPNSTKKFYSSWFELYLIYWVILAGLFIWIFYKPDTIKIISFIIGLGLQIFNTTKIKEIRKMYYQEIKEEILENLEDKK